MRMWVNMLLVLLLMAGFANVNVNVKASSPIPEPLEPTFQHLPEFFKVGKTYPIEVVSINRDDLIKTVFAFSGENSEEVENVETVLTDDGKFYKTTGEYTPKQAGIYTLKFTITEGNEHYNTFVDSVTVKIKAYDGDKPDFPEPIASKITTSPNKYEAGKKIKITVTTPNMGTILEEGRFVIKPSGDEQLKDLKTVRKGNQYITTANFTPQRVGEFKIDFSMKMRDKDGIKWEGTANHTMKVNAPKLKKVKAEFIPMRSKLSLQDGGQVALIVKVPKNNVNQDYVIAWSDNVDGLEGPVSTDDRYAYFVGMFKAEKMGAHQVAFKIYREYQWEGEAKIQVVVEK